MTNVADSERLRCVMGARIRCAKQAEQYAIWRIPKRAAFRVRIDAVY
jgi:hypothetical protein